MLTLTLMRSYKSSTKLGATTLGMGLTWLKICRSGHRVSFAWDTFNKCVQCFIMCTDSTMDQAGYILVGRGSHPLSAFAQAVFKDEYVAQGNWKAFSNSRQQDWD